MDEKKLKFANDVIIIIRDICALVFNITTDAQYISMFSMSQQELELAIKNVVDLLPNVIFSCTYPHALDDVKIIFAREFIFFQIQEKVDDPHYSENLSNFTHIFSRDIQQRLMAQESCQFKMKEE